MKPEISRVSSLSPDELDRQFLSRGKAVVLTDALAGWPAAEKWTFDHFRTELGSRVVGVRGGNRYVWRRLLWATLAEYVDFIENEPADSRLAPYAHLRPYAAFNRLDIEEDVAFARLLPPSYGFYRPRVWIGPARAITPLHNDTMGLNVFVQVVGRKRFILYPVSDTPNLYPSDLFDYLSFFSEVDLERPDLARHPNYARTSPVELIVNPGEILILPRSMWHEVHALEPSISVNAWAARRGPPRPDMLLWHLKGALHLAGLYKRRRCTCHIDELSDQDVAALPLAMRVLTRIGGLKAHGNDLCRMLGWTEENFLPADHPTLEAGASRAPLGR
jgi:hypothetical protein